MMDVEPAFAIGDTVVFQTPSGPQVGVIDTVQEATKVYNDSPDIEYRILVYANRGSGDEVVYRWEDEIEIHFPDHFYTNIYKLTIM